MNKDQWKEIWHKNLAIDLIVKEKNIRGENNCVLDITETANFCLNLEKCLKSNEYHNNIEKGPISLVLVPKHENNGRNILLPDEMADFLSTNKTVICNVIQIDIHGIFIGLQKPAIRHLNYSDALNYSKNDREIVFYVQGTELHVFIDGTLIDFIPDIYSYSRDGRINTSRLPISEYYKLIKAHEREELYKEKGGVKYWEKKADRILVKAPEIIFHKSLYSFFRRNIQGGTVDPDCYNDGTSDKVDIRVIRYPDNKVFIFEIKWLGISSTMKTLYSDDQANAGIVQLNEYLNDENNAICGVLVIYDARKDNIEIKWNDSIKWDPRIEETLRCYLVSETASQKGKRVVRENKKTQKAKGS